MMAVEAVRVYTVETTEFVELGCHDVLEGTDEPRVKHDLGKAVAQQVSAQLLLAFLEPCGTPLCRKRRRKVEVQPGIDPAFPRQRRGSFRILHEDHGTYGGDGSPQGAIEDPPGGSGLSPPIVGVQDEQTCVRRPAAPARRRTGRRRSVRGVNPRWPAGAAGCR